jgi:hypothetical protein
VATAPNDVDEIRRQMAQIRRELHRDVREVVAGAEAVTDWQRHIRNHPWISLGSAFALGYLLVPRRHRHVPSDVATQAGVASTVREAIQETAEAAQTAPREKRRGGLVRKAFGLVGPLAARVAQGYAMQFLENWLAQQAAAQPGPAEPSVPGGPPRGPGGGYRPPGRSPI